MNERNADVSKTLTEQRKKGKLPDGFYWIEFQDGEILPTTFSSMHGFIYCDSLCDDENIKQILEEMPSFEQWQDQVNATRFYADKFFASCDEKTKLKELLKNCRDILLVDEMNATAHYKKALQGLLTKINQVLGEE